jgi:hypothetical protein
MGRAADALVYDFPNKSKNRAGCAPEGPSPSACLPLSPRLFAKIAVENINSNLATFIRTLVVLFSFLVSLPATGQLVHPSTIQDERGPF